MTRDDIIRMAWEAGIHHAHDSEGHWDGLTDEEVIERVPPSPKSIEYSDRRIVEILERFAALVAAAEREKVARWMMERGYSTGHGDTTEDLLQELDWQIAENWNRALINGITTEREACAKVCDAHVDIWIIPAGPKECAAAIRARGETK
jgi:hypothetical protein